MARIMSSMLAVLTIHRVVAAIGSRVEVVKGRVEEVVLQTKVCIQTLDQSCPRTCS